MEEFKRYVLGFVVCSETKEVLLIQKPIHMKYNELFDGRWRTAEEICTPPKQQDSPFMSHKIVFLD